MNKLLEINNVDVKGANSYRLKNIQLTIYEADKIALLGRSGSGKSTLISIANGSINPSHGDVKWKGIKLNSLKRNQRVQIGTLWQDLRLVEDLNVQQNINTGVLGHKSIYWALKNLLGNIETITCLNYLESCGLTKEVLSTKVNKLSGGQRQRVAIARLLRQRAKFILADEPLSSLDPLISKDIINLFFSEENSSPINIPNTFLMSLHNPEIINQFTRVVGLKKGKLVLDIPTKEINQSQLEWLYET